MINIQALNKQQKYYAYKNNSTKINHIKNTSAKLNIAITLSKLKKVPTDMSMSEKNATNIFETNTITAPAAVPSRINFINFANQSFQPRLALPGSSFSQ